MSKRESLKHPWSKQYLADKLAKKILFLGEKKVFTFSKGIFKV